MSVFTPGRVICLRQHWYICISTLLNRFRSETEKSKHLQHNTYTNFSSRFNTNADSAPKCRFIAHQATRCPDYTKNLLLCGGIALVNLTFQMQKQK